MQLADSNPCGWTEGRGKGSHEWTMFSNQVSSALLAKPPHAPGRKSKPGQRNWVGDQPDQTRVGENCSSTQPPNQLPCETATETCVVQELLPAPDAPDIASKVWTLISNTALDPLIYSAQRSGFPGGILKHALVGVGPGEERAVLQDGPVDVVAEVLSPASFRPRVRRPTQASAFCDRLRVEGEKIREDKP